MKAIVRYDGKLEDGLFEVTINSNYIIERRLKNVKVKVIEKTVNNRTAK